MHFTKKKTIHTSFLGRGPEGHCPKGHGLKGQRQSSRAHGQRDMDKEAWTRGHGQRGMDIGAWSLGHRQRGMEKEAYSSRIIVLDN